MKMSRGGLITMSRYKKKNAKAGAEVIKAEGVWMYCGHAGWKYDLQ